MKKDYRNILYGFTMAEILISLAIAMIVATAMVPVFGTKKVKHPTNKIVHGVAACYYDSSGTLRYDYRENRADAPSTGTPQGGVCTFPIPKSSYLEVIAIGPGGASHPNPDRVRYRIPSGSSYAGSLRIDNNFQFDIDESSKSDPTLPGKLRIGLSEWQRKSPGELYAQFTNITSPLGAGGTGKCMQRAANGACGAEHKATGGDGPYGSWYSARAGFNASNTTSNCWWFQHGKGGSSGLGAVVSSRVFPINGNSVITAERNSSRTKVGVKDNSTGIERYTLLTASGAGGSATCTNGVSACSHGANSGSNSTCQGECSGWGTTAANPGASGGEEHEYSRTCTDVQVSAREGNITYLGAGASNSYNGGAINWTYNRPVINVDFATMGGYGAEISQVYHNIKGTLELIPANNSGASIVRKDGTEILRANQGTPAIDKHIDGVMVNETFPEEIMKEAVPDNDNHFGYLDKLKGSGYNLPLFNCQATQSCPGYAGRGKYLLFRSTSGLETLTLENRQNGKSYTHDFGQDFNDTDENIANRRAWSCKDNDVRGTWASITGREIVTPCTGANRDGGRGAIVVIW